MRLSTILRNLKDNEDYSIINRIMLHHKLVTIEELKINSSTSVLVEFLEKEFKKVDITKNKIIYLFLDTLSDREIKDYRKQGISIMRLYRIFLLKYDFNYLIYRLIYKVNDMEKYHKKNIYDIALLLKKYDL